MYLFNHEDVYTWYKIQVQPWYEQRHAPLSHHSVFFRLSHPLLHLLVTPVHILFRVPWIFFLMHIYSLNYEIMTWSSCINTLFCHWHTMIKQENVFHMKTKTLSIQIYGKNTNTCQYLYHIQINPPPISALWPSDLKLILTWVDIK